MKKKAACAGINQFWTSLIAGEAWLLFTTYMMGSGIGMKLKTLGLLVIPFVLLVSISDAADVTLQWDTNSDADYYVLYWGDAPGSYTANSGKVNSPTTTYTVTGLDSKKYYFAVKAINACGNTSDFSTEISYDFTISLPNKDTDLTLQWDTNSDADYYVLYWGDAPGSYTANSGKVNSPATNYRVTGLDAKTYYFAVKAFNFCGNISDFSNEISFDMAGVESPDIPPTASTGPNQTVPEGVIVTINGANSIDPDGSIASYLWTQTAGPPVTLSSKTAVSPTFTSPDVGIGGTALTFQLTVTDQDGLKSTDSCIVNVSFINTPPVAVAGPTQTVTEGTLVTLSAANSNDPDDGIASYLWVQTAGPSVTLSTATAMNPTFKSPDVGTEGTALSFEVTVTDKGGLQSTDTCIVNVSFVNTTPVAEAGPTQTVGEGTTVSLSAANSSDSDDGIASYQWIQTAGPSVTLSDASAMNPTFKSPDVNFGGTALTFKLTVTDHGGLKATDSCIVNVSFINEAPVADAGQDQTVKEGASVTLNAGGSADPDDGIVSYSWIQTAGPSVALSSAAAISPTFKSPDVGTGGVAISFKLTVTDQGGLQASDTCIVNISYVDTTPVAKAGPEQTIAEKTTVTLSAEGSTALDNSGIFYRWSQTSGPAVALSNPTTAKPTFVAPDVDSTGAKLTFRLTVINQDGLQATDSCTVNVFFINTAPTADAGSAQTVTGNKVVTLDGSGSSDPDNSIVSFLWEQTDGLSVILSGTTDVLPTFTAPKVSTEGAVLSFRLTVTDQGGLKSSATCTVTVESLAAIETPVEPVSPESLVSMLSDHPSIEIVDTNFQHLEWLQIGWAEYNRASGEARIATGDIDGDGKDEIIVGMGQVRDNPEIPGGFFQILDDDYTHLAWGYINWPEYNAINGETWPACGDINGDGDDEIIVGLGQYGEGTIEVFDYDSKGLFHIEWVIADWVEYNSLIGETRPACGDIDNDGMDEIVVGFASMSENTAIPNGYFEIIESDFTHTSWGEVDWLEYNSTNGEIWPVCGDVNGNGYDEIIAGLGVGGNGQVEILEYREAGVIHLEWLHVDWLEYNDSLGETRPGSVDIDDDGKKEVLIGLGPVMQSRSIPAGRYQANDDDYNMLSWGRVTWRDYNTANGETRPVSGMINGSQSVFLGLGKKTINENPGWGKPTWGRSSW